MIFPKNPIIKNWANQKQEINDNLSWILKLERIIKQNEKWVNRYEVKVLAS